MTNLRPAINAVLAQFPTLCSDGWRSVADDIESGRAPMLSAIFEQEVLDVLVDAGSKSPRLLGSYGLKHRVEARCGRYISSGAAIVAMLILGYEPVRTRREFLNCGFSRATDIEPHPAFRGPNTHMWAGR